MDERDHTAYAFVKSEITAKPGMSESTNKKLYVSKTWKE